MSGNINQRAALNLRIARLRAGLTGVQLAAKLNIAPSYLCRLEKGQRRLNIKLIMDICRILKVDANQLLGFENLLDDKKKYDKRDERLILMEILKEIKNNKGEI